MPSVVSIESGRKPRNRRSGEYLLVELVRPEAPRPIEMTRPGEAPRPGDVTRTIGVLLRDTATGELYSRIRDEWKEIEDAEEAGLLEALHADFQAKIREMGGERFLESLEDTLSNSLRLSARSAVEVDDFPRTLERLYAEHVEGAGESGEPRPFVTHLPLYSLQAAATKFGEDREVESEGWVKAPARLRLTPYMFVARVVGRSMEPRIPDGSLCIFRAGVVGSRQGKLVLVERFGATDTSARYTIKKYTSKKSHTGDEQWTHTSVRLEPLNPEFEGFELKEGEARVIAEFVTVLEN